jgi:hypothetical protein
MRRQPRKRFAQCSRDRCPINEIAAYYRSRRQQNLLQPLDAYRPVRLQPFADNGEPQSPFADIDTRREPARDRQNRSAQCCLRTHALPLFLNRAPNRSGAGNERIVGSGSGCHHSAEWLT